MLEEIKDCQGAQDVPNQNDYSAVHVLGEPSDVAGLPSSVNINSPHSHNQGASWHCTAYAICHVHEILNSKEHNQEVTLDPEEQWTNQCVSRGVPNTISGGDTLQNALSTLVKRGLLNKLNSTLSIDVFEATGYALIDKTVESFKRWLATGYPIYTGWNLHCFPLVGYDDEKAIFIAKNSYGSHWGAKEDGTFEVPYKDFNKLFSPYVVYDKKDIQNLFRDVSESSPNIEAIKFVLDNKLMMGYGTAPLIKDRFFRPDQPMTRVEVATVLERLYKLLKG